MSETSYKIGKFIGKVGVRIIHIGYKTGILTLMTSKFGHVITGAVVVNKSINTLKSSKKIHKAVKIVANHKVAKTLAKIAATHKIDSTDAAALTENAFECLTYGIPD